MSVAGAVLIVSALNLFLRSGLIYFFRFVSQDGMAFTGSRDGWDQWAGVTGEEVLRWVICYRSRTRHPTVFMHSKDGTPINQIFESTPHLSLAYIKPPCFLNEALKTNM